MHIPIEKKKRIIKKLFELVKKKWEVYLPLEGNNNFIILKTVCAKCETSWYVDEKECFFCKMRYLRAIKCSNCGMVIAEENIRHCPFCKKGTKGRACLNCRKSEDGQFVPITFCSKCGNRENKLESKILTIK